MCEMLGTQVGRSLCSCVGLIRSDRPDTSVGRKHLERYPQDTVGMLGEGVAHVAWLAEDFLEFSTGSVGIL